MYSLELPLTYR